MCARTLSSCSLNSFTNLLQRLLTSKNIIMGGFRQNRSLTWSRRLTRLMFNCLRSGLLLCVKTYRFKLTCYLMSTLSLLKRCRLSRLTNGRPSSSKSLSGLWHRRLWHATNCRLWWPLLRILSTTWSRCSPVRPSKMSSKALMCWPSWTSWGSNPLPWEPGKCSRWFSRRSLRSKRVSSRVIGTSTLVIVKMNQKRRAPS